MEKVLIVVDMLNDFCHPKGVLATSPITNELYAKSIIANVKTVVDYFRESSDPIIWLADAHDKEFDRFPKHAVKGTWGSKIIDELRPAVIGGSVFEDIIEKTRYSGFYNTNLEAKLEQRKPEVVVVVGVCTSICVTDTIGGLANRDYKIVVRKDCVADFDPEAHWHAIERIEKLYGASIV
jgi:nicotinamidase-related amidase